MRKEDNIDNIEIYRKNTLKGRMPGNPFGFPACIMKKFIQKVLHLLPFEVSNDFPFHLIYLVYSIEMKKE